MGKASSKKTSAKSAPQEVKQIGLTEQLNLLKKKNAVKFGKSVRALRQERTDQLAKAIKKASNNLVKHDEIEGLELITLMDAWSASTIVPFPGKLLAAVNIPEIERAAIISEFLINDEPIILVPESHSLALSIATSDDADDAQTIYAMVDPEVVVNTLVVDELFDFPLQFPTGIEVLSIIEWLDHLAMDMQLPDEVPSKE